MLKFKLTKEQFEELSEAEKTFYALEGDTAVLQVEGVVPKDKHDEFRENNIELSRQLESFKGIDPAKYAELVENERKAQEKKMVEEGDIEKLLDQRTGAMKSDYEAKIKKLTSDLEASQKSYTDTVSKYEISGAAQKAFATHKINPEMQDFVMTKINGMFTIDNGQAIARNGDEIMTGANGNLTIDEYVGGLPDTFRVPSSGGRGNGSNAGGAAQKQLSGVARFSDALQNPNG